MKNSDPNDLTPEEIDEALRQMQTIEDAAEQLDNGNLPEGYSWGMTSDGRPIVIDNDFFDSMLE